MLLRIGCLHEAALTCLTLPIRRRTRMERRVIAIVRGGDHGTVAGKGIYCFTKLRALAADEGLAISPPGTPYVTEDELSLISWLANAQRLIPVSQMPKNPQLVTLVRQCAGVLSERGLRLSSLTLYSSRLRGMAS